MIEVTKVVTWFAANSFVSLINCAVLPNGVVVQPVLLASFNFVRVCRRLATAALLLLSLHDVSFASVDAARDAIKRKDFVAAAHLLRSVEPTTADAQYLLAGLHSRGQGVARDRERAAELYQNAAEAGHEGARAALANEWLATMLVDIEGLDLNEALRVAATRGSLVDMNALLANGAEIDAIDVNGRTALMDAAEFGGNDVVSRLLDAGANPNVTDGDGESALLKAIRANDTAAVDSLLSRGARTDLKDQHGNTALHFAARYQSLPILERLIQANARLDVENARGMSALTIASRRDDTRLARALRRAGATSPTQFAQQALHALRAVDRPVNGRNVWFIAAERGDLPTLRRELAAGASLDARNGESMSALMLASRRGYIDVADWLLGNGASIVIEDRNDRNALTHAAEAGQPETLELLLEHALWQAPGGGERLVYFAAMSGDPETVDVALRASGATESSANGDLSALMFAAQAGLDAVAARLVAAGAAVDAVDRQRRSALWYAADSGHLSMLNVLLTAGADINAVDRSGTSALHRASERGHAEVVRALLNAGADANAENQRGYTPLMAALEARRYGVIEILARSNVEIDRRNSFGQTALILAAFRNDSNAINTLLAFGADAAIVNGERRNAADIAERLGNDAALTALDSR